MSENTLDITVGAHVYWLTGTQEQHGRIESVDGDVATILPCQSSTFTGARHQHIPGTQKQVQLSQLRATEFSPAEIGTVRAAMVGERLIGRHVRVATSRGQRTGVVVAVEYSDRKGDEVVVRTHPDRVVPDNDPIWAQRRVDWPAGPREFRAYTGDVKVISEPAAWTSLTDDEQQAALA